LLDMGVDSYLLSTSLIGIVAQRLIRVLCKKCTVMEDVTEQESIFLELSGLSAVKQLPRAVGCEACFDTGYRGRVAVHEVLTVSEAIGGLITAHSSLSDIRKAGTAYGYAPMQTDAMERVIKGITTLEEARRAIFFRPGQVASAIASLLPEYSISPAA
jgi:type IV pilus assembly protein PilB